MKNLWLLLLLIIIAPADAMNKRPASAEILVPGTPPTIPGTPVSSDYEDFVPGSPEEFDAALLRAELDEEVARRNREQALKQLREEERRNKSQELAKKKAAAECKRQSKKPKKDS